MNWDFSGMPMITIGVRDIGMQRITIRSMVICSFQGGMYVATVAQKNLGYELIKIDLMIHIGEVSATKPKFFDNVWRVNPDGEVRDTFQKLNAVFAINEEDFFKHYNSGNEGIKDNQYQNGWMTLYDKAYNDMLDLSDKMPFSNMWIAIQLHKRFISHQSIHLGILNSLRCYNMLPLDKTLMVSANVGGFGIDGCVSTMIGASVVNREKIFYGIVGDLAFFYDMNALGNRHIENNIRLLIINNGMGAEFKRFENDAMRLGLGQEANPFISAEGHFGNKSKALVKHYAEDLGFQYISAENKESFMKNVDVFINGGVDRRSVLFEVFTNDSDDVEALSMVGNLEKTFKSSVKNLIKSVIGRT